MRSENPMHPLKCRLKYGHLRKEGKRQNLGGRDRFEILCEIFVCKIQQLAPCTGLPALSLYRDLREGEK